MSTSCNRLISATSPYLRAAAHQPVHWNPWDDVPFERAKREDKPILLDIGASWCHWCHVMDTESYDDPKVAMLLGGEDGSYHHSVTGNLTFLDDQVQMGSAALACYELSGDPTYLKQTQLVRDVLLNDYYDHGSGGIFDLPVGQRRNDAYLSHMKPRQDSPATSASVVTFLLRLDAVTPNDASLVACMASPQWICADALEHPLFHAGFLHAMALQIQEIPWINSAPGPPRRSRATICVGRTCLRPASSLSDFERHLSELWRQIR